MSETKISLYVGKVSCEIKVDDFDIDAPLDDVINVLVIPVLIGAGYIPELVDKFFNCDPSK